MKVGDEPQNFRNESCMDQIFVQKIIFENYLQKIGSSLLLSWTYRRLWDVLRMYCVGRPLLEGSKLFYKDVSVLVDVNRELSDSYSVDV